MRAKTGTDTGADLKEQSLGRRANQLEAPLNPLGQSGKPSWKQETPSQAALFSLCDEKEKGVEDDENRRLFCHFTTLQADNSLH